MPATILALTTVLSDFPELTWASTTTLNITGKRGNGMSVVLNDGSAKTNATNTNGWALASNLDTGSVANSTWYYLYAIASGSGFIVKASVTKPTYVAGAGPTGFATHRYLGSIRTDASGNILRFFKDKGFYQYSSGAVDAWASGNPLNIYSNPGTTTAWTIALNGLTKYPQTAQMVKVGTGGSRTNDGYVEQAFQEQISGVYYYRAAHMSRARTSGGGNYLAGTFYECDLINGVWQVIGATGDATAINAGIWVDGCREPSDWFKV